MHPVRLALTLVLVAACGGDDGRELTGSPADKIRQMAAGFEGMIDSVCSCPNTGISVTECRTQLDALAGSDGVNFECLATTIAKVPENQVKNLDCGVSRVLDLTDCMVAAGCDAFAINACNKLADKLDSCPEVSVPAEFEAELSACVADF